MKLVTTAALGVYALCALLPDRSGAQVPTQAPVQLPGGLTPEQALELLRTNPQLAAIFRQRIQQSGLTPDQIRARLAAAGYPPNMLDAYLGQGGGGGSGDAGAAPSGQEGAAILTLERVRDVLYDRLGHIYSKLTRSPTAAIRFDLTVASVRANQISVVGEVRQPGAYQISALGTALTALYAAGGVTERANMRQIDIRRLGRPVATLDLYDYLLRGDTRNDIRLETGDVVFVPLHGRRVQLTGAVLRPAIYELKEGETLVDLVRAAGGFRANALLERVAVHRILPAGQRKPGPLPRAALDVALTVAPSEEHATSGQIGQDPKAEGSPGDIVVPALPLENGDSVVVDSIGPLTSGLFVAIAGMVKKPWRYPWQQGMTLRDLVTLARGPTVGAYLKQAAIT